MRGARDAEARRDVRTELHAAHLLLADPRIELAFEAYGSGRGGPDFTVTLRGERPFNLEVTRLRRLPGAAGPIGQLLAKLRQLPPSAPNAVLFADRRRGRRDTRRRRGDPHAARSGRRQGRGVLRHSGVQRDPRLLRAVPPPRRGAGVVRRRDGCRPGVAMGKPVGSHPAARPCCAGLRGMPSGRLMAGYAGLGPALAGRARLSAIRFATPAARDRPVPVRAGRSDDGGEARARGRPRVPRSHSPRTSPRRARNSGRRDVGLGSVLARMLGWRRIATADVATQGTPAQVEPPATGGQALDAARSARRYGRIYPVLT